MNGWRASKWVMSRQRRKFNACLVAVALLATDTCNAVAQDVPRPSLQFASAEAGYQTTSGLLGRPVLVSRSDVETSGARVRSVEIIDGPSPIQSPAADPAFKAVLLTPRGSTGRPIPTQLASLPDVQEPIAKEPESPAGPSPAAVSSTTAKIVPEPSAHDRVPARPVERLAPTTRSAMPIQKPASRPKTAQPERPSYGTAEIAATRAFTRF
jgi:hypothetical protein